LEKSFSAANPSFSPDFTGAPWGPYQVKKGFASSNVALPHMKRKRRMEGVGPGKKPFTSGGVMYFVSYRTLTSTFIPAILNLWPHDFGNGNSPFNIKSRFVNC